MQPVRPDPRLPGVLSSVQVRERDEGFVAFVRAHRTGLVRTAAMWCHGDVHRAEDLVQTALGRVYVAWSRVRAGTRLAYTRRAMYHAMLDEHRRPASRRERSTAEVPDHAAPSDPTSASVREVDALLLAALAALPTRMRAAVVLRHLDGLSVVETAAVLGCSTGTVKSQTARGLDHLRAALGDAGAERPPPPDRNPSASPLRSVREALS